MPHQPCCPVPFQRFPLSFPVAFFFVRAASGRVSPGPERPSGRSEHGFRSARTKIPVRNISLPVPQGARHAADAVPAFPPKRRAAPKRASRESAGRVRHDGPRPRGRPKGLSPKMSGILPSGGCRARGGSDAVHLRRKAAPKRASPAPAVRVRHDGPRSPGMPARTQPEDVRHPAFRRMPRKGRLRRSSPAAESCPEACESRVRKACPA